MTNAVKSFIVDNGKLLLIKRQSNDIHCADAWEVPGGRLKDSENPIQGLKRETKEETGLEIDIIKPIKTKSFISDDKVSITLTSYLCKLKGDSGGSVKLSEEHTEHEWVPLSEAPSKIVKWFKEDLERIERSS